jgi:transcriptional regulator with XRE-family HTH domain
VEFGGRCGFYQTYLIRLERGQANPTLNAMEVIANGLGLTVYELWDHVSSLGPRPISADNEPLCSATRLARESARRDRAAWLNYGCVHSCRFP